MTDWSTKAKLLYTDKPVVSLAGYDGGIFKHGASFHDNVQKAHDAGKPCMLFMQSNPDLLFDATLNPAVWQTSQDFENLISDIFIGGAEGTKRKIHGVILDISKTMHNGNKIPVQWVTGYGGWLLDMIWDATKLPVYIYCHNDVAKAYKDTDLIDLQTFLISRANVSTISLVAVDENGMPGNNVYPALPYNDSGRCPWYFWLYKVVAQGIDVLYWQNKDVLYNDLNFKSGTVTPPPPIEDPEDPTNPPVIVPGTGTDAEMKAAVIGMFNILKRVFGE